MPIVDEDSALLCENRDAKRRQVDVDKKKTPALESERKLYPRICNLPRLWIGLKMIHYFVDCYVLYYVRCICFIDTELF